MDKTQVETKVRKAIGFFRAVGEASDPQSKKALLDQEASFHLFCNREGYEAADVFTETDHSGRSNGTYSDMLRYIRNSGDISAVVVSSLDVLGHKREELAISLLEMRPRRR